MFRLTIFISLALAISACDTDKMDASSELSKASFTKPAVNTTLGSNNNLGEYWYQGKAEISRYELLQNRYKDLHPGEAIMIFVTEDFLTDKQVKNDRYTNPNSIPILKNNQLRKFPTGLYDYSMMTSVFTPVNTQEVEPTLKVTTSSQEWCGHTYMQVNHEEKNYRVTLHSYFEGEADKVEDVAEALLEDELFNRIRINPESLPTGKIKVLPSTVVTRLAHMKYQPIEATASNETYTEDDFDRNQLKAYTLKFPSLNRIFQIIYQAQAPYIIEGWKDSYPSMFDKTVRTTVAKRTHTIKNAYWGKNGLNDMTLRKELGMD